MMRILILNGPNLNLLGTREPEIYGSETLADIDVYCLKIGKELGADMSSAQSNHEGELVDLIQKAIGECDGIIINAGAYTHTSVAIHDALRAFPGKVIELHISNPHQRESFRHKSFIAPLADAVILGLGTEGYELAIKAMIDSLKTI
ncbi:MAG: type II 3-dehydroquinate dehydratase [Hellea sp.]|nr:type II 3-dehydroquinate dehydratase [Hellea sp.]